MLISDFIVQLVDRPTIKDFIEKYHYSHNINGVISDYCFALYHNKALIGAMIYGRLAMRNQYKKYCSSEKEIMELRRLVCVDDTPRNTESFFIGYTLRWLKKNTNLKYVISYADSTYGHIGTIYKASNFKLVGKTAPIKVIKRLSDSKLFHDKTIRTKYKGNLKPFALKLKIDLLEGRAIYITTKEKYIYIYQLSREI